MSKVFQALERAEGSRRSPAPVFDGVARNGGHHRGSADHDEYERLAARIIHARAAAPFKTILVTAPDHGEGTSTVAERLAASLSERGQLDVVLVDANLRTPARGDMLAAQAGPGLAEALSGAAGLDAVITETDTPRLRLLPAGAVDQTSPRLLDSPRLGALIETLAAQYDVVILDGAPVLPYADTLTLASKVDRVVLVTQADRTQRGHLERATDELLGSGAAILGVVLNRKASHTPPWLQRRLNL